MANFETAHKILEKIEGGYVNDPLDRGGETINGIARKFHPTWEGWKIVDSIKTAVTNGTLKGVLKKELAKNEDLHKKIGVFYKKMFWDKMRLDEISSQVAANNMYLFGVNAGIVRAVKYAQQVANTEKIDGKIGPKTIAAINAMNEADFKREFDSREIAFYKSIVEKTPSQQRFLKGWLNRADLV